MKRFVSYIMDTNGVLSVDAKLASFWNLVTDDDKQIFSNDKFLSQASDNGQFDHIVIYCVSHGE